MSIQAEDKSYVIHIDGAWAFVDFSEFSRVYTQAYSLIYSLSRNEIRGDYPYVAFPWKGGYSAVNFYNQLYRAIPRKLRPRVIRISFASPGIIELSLWVAAALNLKKIVGNVVDAGRDVHGFYREIYKGMHERKLMRISAKKALLHLRRDELLFIKESADHLSKLMGLHDLQALHVLTQNPLTSLRILLSLYRRVRKLGALLDNGKIDL